MAKKLTLSDLDFSRSDNTPDWAASLRQQYIAEQNKESEAAAIVNQVAMNARAEGNPLSDAQLADLWQHILDNGSVNDWTPPPADFSNVESGSSTTEVVLPDPNSWEGRKEFLNQNVRELGAVVDTGQAAVQDALAGAAIKAADSPDQIRTLTRAVPGLTSLSGLADLVLPETEQDKQKWMDASESFAAAAKANRDLADPIKEEAMPRGGEAWRQYVETVFDVAGSPSSAASLIGGPAAALPFADVYLREYGAARRAGLDPKEADIHAMGQAVPEGAISAIPAGKLLGGVAKRVPGVSKVAGAVSDKLAGSLESRLGQTLNTASRAALTAAGEGTEEGVTFMIQDAANRIEGLVGSERARQYALENVVKSENYMTELWRNARAGMAMGGPVGAVEGAITSAKEGARMRADREQGLEDTINTTRGNMLLAQRTDADLAELKADTELNQDIAFEEQRIANQEGLQQGFEQAEKAAAEQKELEEEAGFETLERGSVSPTSRVERYADVVERVPVEPAREVRPEDVAERRAAEQRAAEEQAERVRQGKLAEELRKRREKAAKDKAEKEKKQTRAQRRAETARRNYIADQVLAENPDATEAELTSEFERRLADESIQVPKKEPAKKPEPTLEAKITEVRNRLEGERKRKVTNMQNARIKAAVRRNPDMSVEELAASLREEGTARPEDAPLPATAAPVKTAIPAPTVSDKELTADDKRIADYASKLGLGMASQDTTKNTPEDRTARDRAFREKGSKLVKSLAARTNKDSRDLQTLLHQEKIVVGLNARDLGRRDEGPRAAEYDPATGKMYIYLDGINPDDAVGSIAAAIHEATHALITPEEIAAASAKIRAAAKNGNTIAQEAVDLAEADTGARKGDTTFEDEEVVAYFASSAKQREGKTLGTVGAVARNLVSAARAGIRKHLNADLDITIGEIATALTGNLEDAARTNIRARGEGPSLAMIVGPGATTWDTLQNKYRGRVDNKERAEILDYKAEITEDKDTLLELARGATLPLGEVLAHNALYTAYPDLINTKIKGVKFTGGTEAAWNGRTIEVDPSFIFAAAADPTVAGEKLRNLILHEVQHAIQQREGFVGGANSRAFVPADIQNEYDLSSDRFDGFVKNFELAIAENTLRPSERSKWEKTLNRAGNPTDRKIRAILFLNGGHAAGSTQPMIQRAGKRYEQVYDRLEKARAAKIEADRKGFATYLRDYGEGEARNTESRSRFDQTLADAIPPEDSMGIDESGVTAEEMVDTRPLARRRQALPSASESLGMAAVNSPERRAVRRSSVVVSALPEIFGIQRGGEWVRNVFTGSVSNSKFAGHALLEAFEHAQSSPSGDVARASQSLGRYSNALHRQAAARGMTTEELHDEIAAKLDEVDKQENSYSANRAAYKAITDSYGLAGKHLFDLRNQVDNLTEEILRLRATSPTKPSAKEAKALKAMAANMGRYSHRLYAMHQGKAGKKYAKAVHSAYMRGKKGKPLNPAQQKAYDMMTRAAEVLIDKNLLIPDDAGIAELGGDDLIRLYKTWGDQPASSLSLDEMRDALAEKREQINGDTDRLQNMADELLKEILDLGNDKNLKAISEYYRGAKQNRGILQERSKIPLEIRAVMGEITDPGTRLLASVAKQAEFVARTKFLLEVQAKADPRDLQPPDAAGTQIVIENKMSQLSGEGYGALDGWYVSPNLRALLDDVRQSLTSFEDAAFMAGQRPSMAIERGISVAVDKWAGVAGFSKRAQIVGNTFLYGLNFAGSWGMPLMNGNIDPRTYAKGLSDALRIIAYEVKPELGLGKAEPAVKYGVTDSATVGELKGISYELIQRMAKEMSGKSPSHFWAAARKIGLTFQHTYAMADVWAKIANFHHEVASLKNYYKLNNESRTEDQIMREAADIVNSTNITYKRAMPLFKALERGGFTAFGTYFYEVFRSQIGNAVQGLKEMTLDATAAKTPAAKAHKFARGSRRLAGQTAFWAIMSHASSVLSQLVFGDDDDEWDKRSLFPEWAQNQDLYPVGLDKNGIPIYFILSRVDPIGPITDIMRQARTGGMDFDQAKEELLNLYVRPRIIPQLWQAGMTIWKDERPRTPLVQQWTPEGYQYVLRASPLEDNTTIALTSLLESVGMPGALNATRKTNPTPAEAYPGAPAGVREVAMAGKILGATFVKPDPQKAAAFARMDYDDFLKNARRDMSDMFFNHPDITNTEILDRIEEATLEEEKYWNEIARVYRAMQQSDMSSAAINETLKEAKVSGELLGQIRSGRFSSQIVSKQSFDNLMVRHTRDLKGDEKKEAEKQWKEAWERLNEVNRGRG